ncbi:unnamed protein product [Rodentolepis nana]|uniref:NAD_binding_1 domain-containing protein n=1 Tax=Rodentolepis nana TaxID=102285 RepID=A0A0R3TMY8_RODNA|nr:unnamed protein product [Rodentolepis nana]
MKILVQRTRFNRRQCISLYTLIYACIVTAFWYHFKPISGFFSGRVAPIHNYRIPDVDGTNTSCRCGKGPQMYIWPPPNGPKDLICSDSTYDLTLCVQVDSTKPPKLTLIKERLLKLRNMSGTKSDDRKEEFADEGKELLRWYQLEGSKIDGKEGYEMYPLAINLTETIKAINKGSPAPFVKTDIFLCGPSGKNQRDLDLVLILVVFKMFVSGGVFFTGLF